MMRKLNKEYVTDIVKKTDGGIEKLGYIMGCRDIKSKLLEEEVDKIVKEIDDTSKKETIDGNETQYGESLHCLIIVYK